MIPGTGTTPVPIDFATTSDDGSMLYIDGNAVVNNNNFQGATQATGIVDLTPGEHTIDVEYYQGGGGATMDLQWDPTGGTNFVDIPNSAFSYTLAVNGLTMTGAGTLNSDKHQHVCRSHHRRLGQTCGQRPGGRLRHHGQCRRHPGRQWLGPRRKRSKRRFPRARQFPRHPHRKQFVPGGGYNVHGTVGRPTRWNSVRPDGHTLGRLRRPRRRYPERLIFGRLPADGRPAIHLDQQPEW